MRCLHDTPNPRCGIPNAPTAVRGVQTRNNRYRNLLPVQVYVYVLTIQTVLMISITVNEGDKKGCHLGWVKST